MHRVVIEGVASRVCCVVVEGSLEQFSLPLDRCCDDHDFFLRGNKWMIRVKANCTYLLVPGRSGSSGTSDDLTFAVGGGDAPRQARGFWSASGEIMSMMLLTGVMSVGVIVIVIVQWSGRCLLFVEWLSLVRYRQLLYPAQ
jgi:hypothetical protein